MKSNVQPFEHKLKEAVIRVLSLERNSLHADTQSLISTLEETYRDTILNEHLYSVDALQEKKGITYVVANTEMINADIDCILEMAAKVNASYIRLIN